MDLNKMEAILQEKTALRFCPICGTPFTPYHSRQKTCGNKECRREYHALQVKEYNERQKADDPEGYRQKRSAANKRARKKQSKLNTRELQLKELSERWQKQVNFEAKVAEYGLDYGKKSAEKVLASVPKIDVNIYGKETDNGQGVLREEELHQQD